MNKNKLTAIIATLSLLTISSFFAGCDRNRTDNADQKSTTTATTTQTAPQQPGATASPSVSDDSRYNTSSLMGGQSSDQSDAHSAGQPGTSSTSDSRSMTR